MATFVAKNSGGVKNKPMIILEEFIFFVLCLICLRFNDFSRASANILPGVPTTICGQLVFKVCWSFLMLMPPKNTETLMLFMYLENLSYSLEIWKANSRVWHITNTLTWPSICSSCWSVARTNTAVFPIPLLAWQIISMPRIAWGIHSCWTVKKKGTSCKKNLANTVDATSYYLIHACSNLQDFLVVFPVCPIWVLKRCDFISFSIMETLTSLGPNMGNGSHNKRS